MSTKIASKTPQSSSSSQRKRSRWQPETLAPNPAADDHKPSKSVVIQRAPLSLSPRLPPPHSYGLDDLERRPIVLPDGSLKYYYALPSDYHVGPAATPPQEEDYWTYLGLDEPRGPPPNRTHRDGDEYAWLRENVRRYGNPNAEGKNGLDSMGLGDDVQVLNEYSRHRGSLRGNGNPNADDRFEERESRVANWFEERESRVANRFKERESKKANGFEDGALKGAFLRCSKLINESLAERMRYLEDGKNGPLRCIVCGRTSKVFAGVHDLIMHAYTSEIPELRIDHLGLHKALCVLMGWNYAKAPEASKAYQSFSAEAAANREDLIVWPPTVIIHNTNTGRRKDGRMDGMSDKEVDKKLNELGFTGGTSKSLYGKGGHLGIAAVRFTGTPAGLKEAERLAEYLKKDKRGCEGWAHVEASQTGSDEKNPAIIKVDKKTEEEKNILYGYLATACDLEKVDIDTRKRAVIKSRKEYDHPLDYCS